MHHWTRRAYNNHHHFACAAFAEIKLYEGRGRDAFEIVDGDFPQARRALKFAMEILHLAARQRRSRSAIMAAAEEARPAERARLLRVAERDARWLRRAPPDLAKAWGAVAEAGIWAVRGDRARAAAALEEAIALLDAVPDRLAAACARLRLGVLLGSEDEKGRALTEAGEAFMREQGIVDPHRIAAALVPGITSSSGIAAKAS